MVGGIRWVTRSRLPQRDQLLFVICGNATLVRKKMDIGRWSAANRLNYVLIVILFVKAKILFSCLLIAFRNVSLTGRIKLRNEKSCCFHSHHHIPIYHNPWTILHYCKNVFWTSLNCAMVLRTGKVWGWLGRQSFTVIEASWVLLCWGMIARNNSIQMRYYSQETDRGTGTEKKEKSSSVKLCCG